MADQINELVQFLKLDTKTEVKDEALNLLLGLSATEEYVTSLVRNTKIIQSVLQLTEDKNVKISKSALLFFINVTTTEVGVKELLKYKNSNDKSVLCNFIGYVLDSNKLNADAACMILSNVTRVEEELDLCVDEFLPRIDSILNAFTNNNYNKNCNLHYLGPVFCNLTRSCRIRSWLTDTDPPFLLKILPFCNYNESVIRKGGAVGVVRNLCFATDLHEMLLSEKMDLLAYILEPLIGGEDYDEDEMEKLPISLQYLPKTKQRESDVDIRKMILDILCKLCTKRVCREILRENGVYYVLREYHKWEKEAAVLLACENVVDILIRKEDEIGIDDLSSLEVSEEMKEKFVKMDEDFIKNCND